MLFLTAHYGVIKGDLDVHGQAMNLWSAELGTIVHGVFQFVVCTSLGLMHDPVTTLWPESAMKLTGASITYRSVGGVWVWVWVCVCVVCERRQRGGNILWDSRKCLSR